MNTHPIIYHKELNIIENIDDFQLFSFDHILHMIIDPHQFLYVDIDLKIRIGSYLLQTECDDDPNSQFSETCSEPKTISDQLPENMNTIESKS